MYCVRVLKVKGQKNLHEGKSGEKIRHFGELEFFPAKITC